MEIKTNIINDFPPTTKEEWVELVKEELKGKDLKKRLYWDTDEGLSIAPFYTEEDLGDLSYLTGNLPGQFPYARGTKTDNNAWEISGVICGRDIVLENKNGLDYLASGYDSITIRCSYGGDSVSGVPVFSLDEMSLLLKDIPIEDNIINFDAGIAGAEIFALFLAEARKRGIDPADLSGSIYYGPIDFLINSGRLPSGEDNCFKKLKDLIHYAKAHAPDYRVLSISSGSFKDAGADIVQELAFTLAAGCEYLVRLTEQRLSSDEIAEKLVFNFSTGSSYFPEIAKLRAARLLWAKIVEKFDPNDHSACQMKIHCFNTGWNKTLYDPHVNMLRVTVESMAAIIGGCDSLSVLPYDSRYGASNHFSTRLSKNTQLILKEEAYLGKIIDPGAGSYYIEKLTDLIARKALDLFIEIESRGGFIKCFRDSFIQEKIYETLKTRLVKIENREDIILGTNQYPNTEEEILKDLNVKPEEITEFELSSKERIFKSMDDMVEGFSGGIATIPEVVAASFSEPDWTARPLNPVNGAFLFEMLRLNTEKFSLEMGYVPKVFLLVYGSPAPRTARASFSTNFFGCGGFDITEGSGSDDTDKLTDEAVRSGARVIVLCSSDEDYASSGAELARKIKDKEPEVHVIVAGYPEDLIENLTESGVDDFIHVGSNAYQLLAKYQEKLGIIKDQ